MDFYGYTQSSSRPGAFSKAKLYFWTWTRFIDSSSRMDRYRFRTETPTRQGFQDLHCTLWEQ